VSAAVVAFNSLAAVERGDDGRTNSMVNSGAIATFPVPIFWRA